MAIGVRTVNAKAAVREAEQVGVLTGPAVAAMVGAGIGTFVMGLMTTLSEVSASFSSSLVLNKGVGPLSGKTTYTVVIWLLAWLGLGTWLKDKNPALGRALGLTVALILLGFALTFPPVFEFIKGE